MPRDLPRVPVEPATTVTATPAPAAPIDATTPFASARETSVGGADPLRVLVVGSLPLAAPWNGADKVVARTLAFADATRRYVVLSGPHEEWPDHVKPVIDPHPAAIPDRDSELGAARYLIRNVRAADVIHVIATPRRSRRIAALGLRAVARAFRRPIVHSIPGVGEGQLDPAGLLGDVTVVFSHHAEQLLRSAGARRVVRLFPPIDLSAVRAAESPQATRRRYDLGPAPILYAAHLDPGNGMDQALEAIAALPARYRESRLALALRWRLGQDVDAELARLAARAEALGIVDRVRFLTDVPDIHSLISACVATVLVPQRLLGKMDLPLVLLESLALGRPVIVSNRPPINEAVLGGGLEVPYGDVGALADALVVLLESSDRREEMAAEGRRNLLALADRAVLARGYGEVYRIARGARIGERLSDGA